jgi:hypothetical protein
LQLHEAHEAEECEFEEFARDVLGILGRHSDQLSRQVRPWDDEGLRTRPTDRPSVRSSTLSSI